MICYERWAVGRWHGGDGMVVLGCWWEPGETPGHDNCAMPSSTGIYVN